MSETGRVHSEPERCLLCPTPLPPDPDVFVCEDCARLTFDEWSRRVREVLRG